MAASLVEGPASGRFPSLSHLDPGLRQDDVHRTSSCWWIPFVRLRAMSLLEGPAAREYGIPTDPGPRLIPLLKRDQGRLRRDDQDTGL
jgi:hypothetical protein